MQTRERDRRQPRDNLSLRRTANETNWNYAVVSLCTFIFFLSYTRQRLRDNDSHGEQGRVRERCNWYIEPLETKCPRHVRYNEVTLLLIFMSGDARMRRLYFPSSPPSSICVITGRVECTRQLSFNWHGKIIGFECEYVALMSREPGARVFFFLYRVCAFFDKETSSRISKTVVLNQRSCNAHARVRFSFLLFFCIFALWNVSRSGLWSSVLAADAFVEA